MIKIGINKVRNLVYFTIYTFTILSCNNASNEKVKINKSSKSNWVCIGPVGGGGTFIHTFSYENEAVFFIRGDMTGAYHTTDGGNSYNQVNYPNGSHAFAYDPLDSKTIYIGSRGLNKSTDEGNTWERIFPFEEDRSIKIFLAKPDICTTLKATNWT